MNVQADFHDDSITQSLKWDDFWNKKQSDETLMNKGFQRITNKIKNKMSSFNCFDFVIELKKKVAKTIVLIHKQIKNVNKILYKIFLVRKNYF